MFFTFLKTPLITSFVDFCCHSRLAAFLPDFAPAFSAADRVIVTQVGYHTFFFLPLKFGVFAIYPMFILKWIKLPFPHSFAFPLYHYIKMDRL